MSENDAEWVGLLTTGLAVFVVAHLLLADTIWYLQYGSYAVAFALLLAAMVRSDAAETA
ncbi:hypothetical protein [Halorussus marinus]|uniref:hypothetical protein n=1 Tax=Halorussus marinus TaxID=2505976 RepID=UPI0014318E2D|nr:hypothetical protein [Halorussus marinus]